MFHVDDVQAFFYITFMYHIKVDTSKEQFVLCKTIKWLDNLCNANQGEPDYL